MPPVRGDPAPMHPERRRARDGSLSVARIYGTPPVLSGHDPKPSSSQQAIFLNDYSFVIALPFPLMRFITLRKPASERSTNSEAPTKKTGDAHHTPPAAKEGRKTTMKKVALTAPKGVPLWFL